MNTLQNLSSELIALAKEANEKKQLLLSDVAFRNAKERFFNFIVKHQPVGYVDFDLNPFKFSSGGPILWSNQFGVKLSASNEKKGLYLSYEITDSFDIPADCYFYMPVEYLNDPEAWEAQMFAEIEANSTFARAAVIAAFGKRVANSASYYGHRVNENDVKVYISTPQKDLPEDFKNSHFFGPVLLNIESQLVTGGWKAHLGVVRGEVLGKVYSYNK